MFGGLGNDTYVVDNVGDRATEQSADGGYDTVEASVNFTLAPLVEQLILKGNAAQGIGNDLDNALIGSAGNNILYGRLGADTLTGGGGNDRFGYVALSDSTAAAFDRILDFNGGDVIDLTVLDANSVTAGKQGFSMIASGRLSQPRGSCGSARRAMSPWSKAAATATASQTSLCMSRSRPATG